jgi:hypothetical protein
VCGVACVSVFLSPGGARPAARPWALASAAHSASSGLEAGVLGCRGSDLGPTESTGGWVGSVPPVAGGAALVRPGGAPPFGISSTNLLGRSEPVWLGGVQRPPWVSDLVASALALGPGKVRSVGRIDGYWRVVRRELKLFPDSGGLPVENDTSEGICACGQGDPQPSGPEQRLHGSPLSFVSAFTGAAQWCCGAKSPSTPVLYPLILREKGPPFCFLIVSPALASWCVEPLELQVQSSLGAVLSSCVP